MKEIYYDELTGFYNRKFLYYWIENEIKRANRFATKFSLILLDIDNFREVNNTFGHLEGDRVLIEFAKYLAAKIREVDNIVRFGGDEFIILMPNTNTKGVLELAQRIIAGLNVRPILTHPIQCSIGFSVFPNDGSTIETLINQADNLMYQAKKQGKNRIGLKPEITKKLLIPSPLTIGREKETDWCLNQLKENNTILIAGEAGIGKTRLVYETRNRMGNPVVLRGNAYAALSHVPYHPFKNMFEELLKQQPELTNRIMAQLPDVYRSEVQKFLPEGKVTAPASIEVLDHYRLYHSVGQFLVKMAESLAPGSIIVLIDDLHWADQPTCGLLDFLIRSAQERIYFFATYRTEEIRHAPASTLLGVWAREKLYGQIRLSPLSEAQAAQLLETMMGAVSPPTVKFIYHESGGNPFYMEELLRELERQRKIFWNGKEWIFHKDQEFTIPSSIEETISRKLRFLNPEVKSILEAMAVYGQEFSPELIALAARRNVGEILDALDELFRLGFIKERAADLYFFSEDIVRQIIYRKITRADLVKHHRAVGEAIENIHRNELPDYAEQLAQHFTIASDTFKALAYSKQAALKAKQNYAYQSAIKFMDNALKFEDNIEEIFKLKSALAEIYSLAGKHALAIQNFQDCLKINPGAIRIYHELGKVYEQKGDHRESLRYYQAGLKLSVGTELAFLFRTAIAWANTRLGRYLKARKECEEILKSKKTLPKRTLGSVYVTLGVVALNDGDILRAENYFRESLKINEALGEKRRMSACYLDLAIAYQNRLDFKTAEELYRKALQIYDEIGYQEGIAIGYLDLGSLYSGLDLVKAEEMYLKGLATAKLIGSKRNLVFLYNNLGYVNYNRMVVDAALGNYRRALELAKEIGFEEGVCFASLSLSELYRETDQSKLGRRYLQTAARIAQKVNSKYYTQNCLIEEINYLLADHNHLSADVKSRKLVAQAKSERDLNYKFFGLLTRGKVLAAMRKHQTAREFFKRAETIVQALPGSLLTAELYYHQALLLKDLGQLPKANKIFLHSFRIYEKGGNLRFMARIEEEMARVNISEKTEKK
jgi:diguanylate cyclase (GGDEF)-like protein